MNGKSVFVSLTLAAYSSISALFKKKKKNSTSHYDSCLSKSGEQSQLRSVQDLVMELRDMLVHPTDLIQICKYLENI